MKSTPGIQNGHAPIDQGTGPSRPALTPARAGTARLPGHALLVALAFLTVPIPSHALENKYDILARLIAPIAATFVEGNGTQAAWAEFTVLELTGAPKEFLGSSFSLALQPPNRLVATAEILGEPVKVCRNRQQVWAAPGEQFDALFAQLEPLPTPDPKFTMGRLRLPFSPEQLALLPALFVATDVGEETVDDQQCRVLDLALMPELARNLGSEDWSARLWITADHKPARLLLKRRDWRLLVAFHGVEYRTAPLPEATWMPGAEDASPVGLDAARLSQLLQRITQEFAGRQKPAPPSTPSIPSLSKQ